LIDDLEDVICGVDGCRPNALTPSTPDKELKTHLSRVKPLKRSLTSAFCNHSAGYNGQAASVRIPCKSHTPKFHAEEFLSRSCISLIGFGEVELSITIVGSKEEVQKKKACQQVSPQAKCNASWNNFE